MPTLRRLLGPVALVTGLAVGGSAGTYIVRPGDTLSAIAGRLGVTAGVLAQANAITDPNRIYAGQNLAVPDATATAPAPGSAATPTTPKHVVGPGETLTGIAARYGSTVDAVVRANGIVDRNRIRIGTALSIPSAAPSTGLPQRLQASPARLALIPHFQQWSAANGLPADLVMALAWEESGWQNDVVSHAGAIGVGQLLPSTAAFVARDLIGVQLDPHIAADNIRMTARYLSWLLKRTGGNVDLALAGYYQGAASVASLGMFPSTVAYIAIVKALRPRFASA